ncbi:MAG TPA: GTPase [archaeon]|nr:GTPase [archaeon]
MPVNPPAEYYLAEEKFRNAKGRDEKILAMEEMIRQMPKHHGSEKALADLKSKLAKLKKESSKKTGGKKTNIHKEGEAQVCIIGLTNSGKSFLLNKLTSAKIAVSQHPYTTVKPEIGMMDYKGVKIQLVEIPSTFNREYVATARTAELILILVSEHGEEARLAPVLKENFIGTMRIIANPWEESPEKIKEKIWAALDMIVVIAKKTNTPMALHKNATVRDFTKKVHKDFLQNFRFARIVTRNKKGELQKKQVGLDFKLKDGDIVEIFTL